MYLLLFILGCLHQSASAQTYLWPTSASQLISSSFCEYRTGHFHAGLDVKTWGREGYPVYAIANGYVARIRVSPYGYGKAIYLKLNDGRTVVYGHLQKFNDAIETMVAEKQDASRQYAVNFWLSPQDFPVTAGQIVGYSGSTGIGYPHLHFEIRDIRNRPINPFLLGYQIKDTQAPVPIAVAATPFGAGSHVQGDVRPQIFTIKSLRKNTYALIDTVDGWGRIGFSVDSYDQADGAYNKFAAYRAQLILNGRPVFTSEYDGFAYSETDQILRDRDYRLMQQGQGRFQNLYLSSGNTLDFYWPKYQGAGLLKSENIQSDIKDPCVLVPGVYPFQIILADFFGNAATIEGVLNWSPNLPEMPHESVLFDSVEMDLASLNDMIRIGIRGLDPLTPYHLRMEVDQIFVQDLPLKYLGANGWMASLPASEIEFGDHDIHFEAIDPFGNVQFSQNFKRTVLSPELRQVMVSKSGKCRVVIHRGALEYPVWGTILESGGLPEFPSAILYEPKPDDMLLNNVVDIAITADSLSEQLGLYVLNREGKLNWVAHEKENGQITARLKYLASMAVVEDRDPPEVFSVQPFQNSIVTERRPQIQAVFNDALSGIRGEDNYRFTLDGVRLLVAYDPEKQTGTALLRHDLAPGKHTLEVVIRDRAKNETRVQRHFFID